MARRRGANGLGAVTDANAALRAPPLAGVRPKRRGYGCGSIVSLFPDSFSRRAHGITPPARDRTYASAIVPRVAYPPPTMRLRFSFARAARKKRSSTTRRAVRRSLVRSALASLPPLPPHRSKRAYPGVVTDPRNAARTFYPPTVFFKATTLVVHVHMCSRAFLVRYRPPMR
jgi:hypothetical protein